MYKVAIFGNALENDKVALKNAAIIAKKLTEDGIRIISGGQKAGTMREAMNAAHEVSQKLKRPDLEPIGFAIESWGPMDKGEIILVDTLSEKLHLTINNADAFIALSGRGGTFLEVLAAYYSINVRKVENRNKRPLIILDPTGKIEKFLSIFEEEYKPSQKNPELKELVFYVNDPIKACEIVKKFKRGEEK